MIRVRRKARHLNMRGMTPQGDERHAAALEGVGARSFVRQTERLVAYSAALSHFFEETLWPRDGKRIARRERSTGRM